MVLVARLFYFAVGRSQTCHFPLLTLYEHRQIDMSHLSRSLLPGSNRRHKVLL